MSHYNRFRTTPLALALAGTCLAFGGLASATLATQDPATSETLHAGNTQPSVAHQAGQAIEQGTITASVKARLLADDRTKAFDINVDTEVNDQGAIVTLEGTAPTLDAKLAAAQVAREVDGVRMVRNRLVVTTDRTDNPQTMSAKAQETTEDVLDDARD